MMMTMVRMRRMVRMQQIQLFLLVLEVKHVGVLSQDQQVGDHSLFSFVPLHTQTNKQTKEHSTSKGDCVDHFHWEAPDSLVSELHRQGHEGVLRTRPGMVLTISFHRVFDRVFDLGERAGLPLS